MGTPTINEIAKRLEAVERELVSFREQNSAHSLPFQEKVAAIVSAYRSGDRKKLKEIQNRLNGGGKV